MYDKDLIYSKIKFLLSKQKFTLDKLCTDVGITDVGFRRMFEKGSLKVSTLDKIADFFQVPITYFFGDEDATKKHNGIYQNGSNNKVRIENEAITAYKELVSELKMNKQKLVTENADLKKKLAEKEAEKKIK